MIKNMEKASFLKPMDEYFKENGWKGREKEKVQFG